jgi:hypothetical protein
VLTSGSDHDDDDYKEASQQDILKVTEAPPPFDMEAYYESLLLPRSFHQPISYVGHSAFSPPPPHHHDMAMMFVRDENEALELDLNMMVELYYPLVHPNLVEYTLNAQTGLRTVRHTFVNLAILPDFILARPDACRALDLLP